MDQFQKLFEDMDVKAADMGAAMDGVYQGTLDQKDVLPRPNEITNRSTI
jgi:hypothetical protein